MPDGRLRGHTSELYWNFVTPYGGVTAATVLNSILLQPQRLGDPVALTVNFAGPIRAGELFVTARLERSNRSTQHWSVLLTQPADPRPLVSAIAVFAPRRPSWGLTEIAPPVVASPQASARVPPVPGLRWPALYEMYYVHGRPGQANDDSITHHWIRDAPPRDLDFASLTSICDAFFPRLFMLRPQVVPVATVSLNIYFHLDSEALSRQSTAHLLGVARGQVYHEGYFDQEAQVWGRDDRLLATTHQLVWFKE